MPEPTKEEVIDESKIDNAEPFETGELLISVLELRGTLTQFKALNDALLESGVQIRELSTKEDFRAKLNELNGHEG